MVISTVSVARARNRKRRARGREIRPRLLAAHRSAPGRAPALKLCPARPITDAYVFVASHGHSVYAGTPTANARMCAWHIHDADDVDSSAPVLVLRIFSVETSDAMPFVAQVPEGHAPRRSRQQHGGEELLEPRGAGGPRGGPPARGVRQRHSGQKRAEISP